MHRAMRAFVCDRARDTCEYCRLRQRDLHFPPFHIEHIVPRQHGGSDDDTNLALACHHCNLHKGPNLTGIDPDTGEIMPLFNPRTQIWTEHFGWSGVNVIGRTPVGRTTVVVLAMNAERQIQLRAELFGPESPT